MKIKNVQTDAAPAAIGPYSQAVVIRDLVFTSGQIALSPIDEEFLNGTIEEQTHRVLKNLEAVLIAAHSSLSNVVKTTIFLREIKDFAVVNSVYAEFFGNHKPARTTVAVKSLPKNALIEIDAIATLNSEN